MKKVYPVKNLHDQILEETGKDLPIGAGSGLNITDPIKMLAHVKYGQTEAAIFNFYLKNYETVAWDVVKQETVVIGTKHIDYFELNVSEFPDSMKDAWTEKYYFDVTDCLKIND